MDVGSRKVGELHEVKIQKDAAELTVQALQQQVQTLKELLDQKKENEEVLKKLEALSITTNSLKDDIGKIKETTERSISFIGSEREKRDKFSTPAAEKLPGTGAKIVLVGRELIFKTINSYKPLARDMDKLVKSKVMTKIIVDENGLDMANDFLKKKHTQGCWGEGALVLVIDGAEGGVNSPEQNKTGQEGSILSDPQKKVLAATAGILSLAVEADTSKAVLLVAGPCSKAEVVAAREQILLKMENGKVTTILKMTKEGGAKDGEAEQSGNWSPLAAAELFSVIAWWADSGYKMEPKLRIAPERCSNCGFVHGEDGHCFKEEIPVARESEEKREEKEDRKSNSSSYASKRPSLCYACGNNHFGICRGRIRYCQSCQTNHAGQCRPETQNYANRGNESKKPKY